MHKSYFNSGNSGMHVEFFDVILLIASLSTLFTHIFNRKKGATISHSSITFQFKYDFDFESLGTTYQL